MDLSFNSGVSLVEIGNVIDASVNDLGVTVFGGLAFPISALLKTAGLFGLIYIALNSILQLRPTNYSVYLHWGLRYIFIFAFATSWTNFGPIYDALQEIPDKYAQLLMGSIASTLPLPEVVQQLIGANGSSVVAFSVFSLIGAFFVILQSVAKIYLTYPTGDLGTSFEMTLFGVSIMGTGIILVISAILVLMLSKVGLAVAIALAPLALVALMNDQTKRLFDNWTHFTIGFAILPLLTSTLMAILFYCAVKVLPNAVADLNFLPFIVMTASATVLLFKVPEMAHTLAGAGVAALSGRAPIAAASSAMRYAGKAFSLSDRVSDGAHIAREARKSGATPREAARAAIAGMRQSAVARQSRRDERLSELMRGTKQKHSVPALSKYRSQIDGS